jgi:hypothetical protein
MNCKYSHTITTARAPGQNVNTRKRKAMIRITDVSKPMLSTLQCRSKFYVFLLFAKIPKAKL